MLTLWRPRTFSSLDREASNMLKHFNGEEPANHQHVDFAPSVDISESTDHYLLQADLPGLNEKDIEVKVHEDTLLLSGKREELKEEKEEGSLRRERRFGSFMRRFNLGKGVDASKIEAKYENGVLSITVPKKEEVQPRKIPVSGN